MPEPTIAIRRSNDAAILSTRNKVVFSVYIRQIVQLAVIKTKQIAAEISNVEVEV